MTLQIHLQNHSQRYPPLSTISQNFRQLKHMLNVNLRNSVRIIWKHTISPSQWTNYWMLFLTSDSAVGPDDIHYQMLKHLPSEALYTLNTLSDIWITGNFPSNWHNSYVVPVPKLGRDSADPSSYRPIALTSCFCQVTERMINKRLV